MQIIPMILAGLSAFLPVVLIVVLQIYLCNLNQRWIGLLLPILAFLFGSFLFYIGYFSGFMDSMVRSALFALIFYLPSLILFLIYLKMNHSNQRINTISQDLS
jgi:hypothetical protein